MESPAVVILLYWHRRGVRSKRLYTLSWVETGSYIIWLLIVMAATRLAAYPSFHWIYGSSVPANLFVLWPFLSALAAFALCLCAVIAKKDERGFVATSNVLMVILWASSAVTPN